MRTDLQTGKPAECDALTTRQTGGVADRRSYSAEAVSGEACV